MAGLAMVALALVACGSGPGATKTQDPVGFKNIEELRQGSSKEITLVNTFSGSELTYSAKSSDRSVATVAVDNDKDSLTVTAVGQGTATITVTAKNSQGSDDQTFTVTVPPATSEPEPEPETPIVEPGAPTVRTGALSSVDVDQGDTQTVTLRRVFTGEDLDFSVSSNDTDVATASIANGILTIRAVIPGSAIITVTASNNDGSATHRITVTVTAPVTTTPEPPTTPGTTKHSNCPSPLEIVRGGHKECTLTKDHSLVYTIPSGEKERVRVSEPDSSATENVWTITAIRKGRPVVQIRDETGDTVDEIVVVVPNTPPRLEDFDGTTGVFPPPSNTETGFHTMTLTDIVDAFTDDDDVDNNGPDDTPADNGIFNYKVEHKPDELLIKTVDGFLLEKNDPMQSPAIDVVVLKEFDEEFSIEVYAYDAANERSDRPVIVTFSVQNPAIMPVGGTYTVTQDNNGNLGAVRIGNRLDVDHTLTFTGGFTFATNWENSLERGDSDYLAGTAITSGTALCSDKTPTLTTTELSDIGSACYTLTPGNNKVKVDTLSFSDGNGQITFQLPFDHNRLNSGSTAITIYYHVRAYEKKYANAAAVEADTNSRVVIKTTSKRLTMNIHKCVVTTDCPIK